MEPHIVSAEDAPRIWDWLQTRGGIKVWNSINLSNPDASWTTPADALKPTWEAGTPRLITDPSEVHVATYEVFKKFHVGVRQGGTGLVLKVSDGGSRRIRRELARAGAGSTYRFDYFAFDNCLILKQGAVVPITEWVKTQ